MKGKKKNYLLKTQLPRKKSSSSFNSREGTNFKSFDKKKKIEKLNIIVEIWNLTSNYNLWLQCKSYMCIEMIYLKVSNIQQVLYISITVLCHQHTIFSHIPPHILLMCHHLQP